MAKGVRRVCWAALALSIGLLAGCGFAIDADQARICRSTLPAIVLPWKAALNKPCAHSVFLQAEHNIVMPNPGYYID